MKKIYLPLFLIGAMLTAACSGQKGAENNEPIDSATAQVDETTKTPVDIITAEGIGPLKLGMPMEEIPASVEGLYDSFKTEKVDDFDDECLAKYKLIFVKEGKTIFECTADDGECTHKNVLADFIVRDATVKIDINGKKYGCGDNVKELIDNKVITVKGNGPFDKSVYMYNDVELQLETDIRGNIKKDNPVIKDMRILNADYITPIPEDFVP